LADPRHGHRPRLPAARDRTGHKCRGRHPGPAHPGHRGQAAVRRQAQGLTLGHYVPHTDAEIAEMLAFIGLGSMDELFATVPEALRLASGADGRYLEIADGLSEFDTL